MIVDLKWIGANFTIYGTIILIAASLLRNLISIYYEVQTEHARYSQKEYRRIVWPALAAKRFFDHVLGPTGERFQDKFTPRIVMTVLAISVAANTLCVAYIMGEKGTDKPMFTAEALKAVASSYAVFLTFNFLGDLMSLAVTRHLLQRITAGQCNFFKYLLLDVGGIFLAIGITTLPAMAAMGFVVFLAVPSNELFKAGLFGGSLGSGLTT